MEEVRAIFPAPSLLHDLGSGGSITPRLRFHPVAPFLCVQLHYFHIYHLSTRGGNSFLFLPDSACHNPPYILNPAHTYEFKSPYVIFTYVCIIICLGLIDMEDPVSSETQLISNYMSEGWDIILMEPELKTCYIKAARYV